MTDSHTDRSDAPLQTVPITDLQPDPRNVNVMAPDRFRKMRDHIKKTGKYPAVTYRQLPPTSVYFNPSRETPQLMLLDGHHRCLALTDLGQTVITGQDWGVMTDEEAALYLGTLNYNKGEPDAAKLADLFHEMNVTMSVEKMAEVMPFEVTQIDYHLEMRQELLAPPPAPQESCDGPEETPVPVRFVVYPEQKKAVDMALAHIERELSGDAKNKKGMAFEMMARNYLSGVHPDELAALESQFTQAMHSPFAGGDDD